MAIDQMFALGTWEQAGGQHGFDIHADLKITGEQYATYCDSISKFRAITERGTYELMLRNWNWLTSMRDMYANIERVGGSFRLVNKRVLVVTFMGEVLNWLTSTRLYLESERDSISRQGTADQVQTFLEVTRRVFDSSAAYRFLYNLRDYAQHCGPPIGGLVVARDDDGSRSLVLYLSNNDLCQANFSWSKHAKQLLHDWPEQISLLPLVAEAMDGFRIIEDTILRILLARCGAAISSMREGIASSGNKRGHPAVFRLPAIDKGHQLAWQSFPTSSGLDDLETALSAKDPLSALRRPAAQPFLNRSKEARHSDSQASAVTGIWLDRGPGVELDEVINRVLDEDQDASPLICGLVNLNGYLLAMLGLTIGTSSAALLGSFLSDSDSSGSVSPMK
jgi:hypothetical protein